MKLDSTPFKNLIKERCGLLFEGNDVAKLDHALAERSRTLALQPTEYYARVQGSEAEFQELVNLLTINETYFFREPEQIRLLVERLAPRFIAARNALDNIAPVRILSAGCASGEEPYSLAMALLDKYGESVSRLFAFAGGDIDSVVLAKARSGRYTDFSFRGVAPAVRQRYFDREHHHNLLKAQVRNLVSFHELNLLADSFPPALRDFDIIFFRNVSIYFDVETRKRIQHNLAALMKDDGVLVIGTAETLANDLGVLPLIEEDGLFYFVKGQPPLPESRPFTPAATRAPLPPFIPLPVVPATPLSPLLVPPGDWRLPTIGVASAGLPVPLPPTFTAPPAVDLDNARQLTRDKRYDEALLALDAVLTVEPGSAEARLLKAHVLLERRDFAAAGELARRVLAVDEWSIDALLLLGLAAKWRREETEAIRCFKQAVYARHECWPAHYYLADIYRNGGAVELARRAYRVVIQLLSGGEPATGIQHVPLGLPAGEVRFLCEHQLGRLPGVPGNKVVLEGQG